MPYSPCYSLNTPLFSILRTIPPCPTFDEATVLASGLLDTVTTDKITFKLSRMSSTSSCDSDGITVIMLRHLPETPFPQQLCQLYHACLHSGQTPARWNEALVYPLCKDPNSPILQPTHVPLAFCVYSANSLCPLSFPLSQHQDIWPTAVSKLAFAPATQHSPMFSHSIT